MKEQFVISIFNSLFSFFGALVKIKTNKNLICYKTKKTYSKKPKK